MKNENKSQHKTTQQPQTKKESFPPGIHYFYAPYVWFVDTTQTPHIVYIRDAQVKVMPGKFFFYNDVNEVSNV